MNALERFNSQDADQINTMQEPTLTNSGLYVWEAWTFKGNNISSVRYFAEDKDGGSTMRISAEDFIRFVS